MANANVTTEWVGGDLYYYDKNGNEIFHIDGTNGRLVIADQLVDATASTLAVTAAAHEGRTVTLNRAAGIAVTLPAATGSGAKYRFVVGTAVSGGSHVIGVTGSAIFKGLALGLDGDGVPANAWAAGASDEVFTMDGSTQGGAVGDVVEFQDIAADVWAVQARLQQSGTEATPFSSAA
ncbi:MAG: hypothetical protein AB7G21_08555 [Dehalococcoidia bacterium]